MKVSGPLFKIGTMFDLVAISFHPRLYRLCQTMVVVDEWIVEEGNCTPLLTSAMEGTIFT